MYTTMRELATCARARVLSTVQSATSNFPDSSRNFDLGVLGERLYSDLDDGDDEIDDLDLDGSGCVMNVINYKLY